MSNKLAYTYEIYIGAPVDRVWAGLIDGDITKKYVYGTRSDVRSFRKRDPRLSFVSYTMISARKLLPMPGRSKVGRSCYRLLKASLRPENSRPRIDPSREAACEE